ncbi:D-alanyl-D-alanine-carboxypeptidase/endopeptidase AmpH [Echria macrotheca]|uniref:D-alanyl-D-alanine-carboxypeptidase/endopeptidase AmpH n=1 Tax=Echria macrotheca TaxID=438768 RepID=A0AAJ0F948_9PEZI|nr:D-alanyl-D-alanine-carboxypeptidase/endopeptidase AmpH [Echria macrotheca]
MSTKLSALLCVVAAAATGVLAAPNCPPLGPVFEPARNFNGSAAIRAALANLTETLGARDVDNGPGVRANETSYSLEVFTTDEANPLLFSWHHTAPTLAKMSGNGTVGVQRTDANTVYRLGSLTKIHTIFTWLAEDGDAKWNEPITKYVPELAAAAKKAKDDPVANVAWDEITIGALASQMGGPIRDYGVLGEVTQQLNQSTMVGIGFPPLNSSDPTLPKCGIHPLCNRTEFFNGLLQAYPQYAPFTTPAYTNTGFQILAYALESITGKSFESTMNDRVLKPLGLKHTYLSNAPASEGIIPGSREDASWDFQLGDEDPAGNLYSSVGDISALGRAILRSTILPPSLTRRWLKPAALSSEPNAGVGYPWGVRRIRLAEANGKRMVDSFNKAGRIGYYSSLMTLLPDYGVGFSILIAGPNIPGNTNFNLADILGPQLLPALETAAREEAQARYGGVYANPSTNSSLRLTTQPDRPGLGIENWISNGTDMQTISVVLAAGYQGVDPSIRLYPTGLETVRPDGSKRVAYKAVYEDLNVPAKPDSMFSTDCGTWVSFTSVTYGTHALDQFIFEVGKDGQVKSLECLALRNPMSKT